MHKLNGYRILTMQYTAGKAHGTHCCQEARQRPRGEKGTPRKSGGFRPVQCTWENTAAFAYDVYEGFQRKEQAMAVAIDLESIQAAEGPAGTIWSQPNTDPVRCRSAPGKYSVYAGWKLEVCSSSSHNGPTTRITVLTDPLQCLYTKGLADLNQTGRSKILILTDDGLIHTTSKHSQEAAEAVQQHLDSVSK